jgi:multicomponent Na+:H+ antiporter subunit F
MTIVIACTAAMLGAAALLLVSRIALGPTMLDRAVALVVLVSAFICGLALDAAIHRDTTTLPILVVLTLLGFVSSVAIARFTPGSDDLEAGEP